MEKQDIKQVIITAILFVIVFHSFDAIMNVIWWIIKLFVAVNIGVTNA